MVSFVYNALAILVASGALVIVRIPPEFADLGELVSVLPVITIAQVGQVLQDPDSGIELDGRVLEKLCGVYRNARVVVFPTSAFREVGTSSSRRGG
jgi:hypothetical protein